MTELVVRNTNPNEPVLLTCAFATHLPLSDIRRAGIGGLHAMHYRDRLTVGAKDKVQADAVSISGALDRSYYGDPAATRNIEIRDRNRVFTLSASGCGDVGLWNPGEAGAERQEYRRMLRVAPGNSREPVRLEVERPDGRRPSARGGASLVARQILSYHAFS